MFHILSGGAESLQCLLQDGTNCPSKLCPNTTVVYSCPLPPLGSQLGYSVWNFSRMTGNCGSKISIQQPILVGCNYVQLETCGPYNGSSIIPCTVRQTTLQVRITQDLNGIIINCQNFALNGTTEDLGTTFITVAPGKSSDIVCMVSCIDNRKYMIQHN